MISNFALLLSHEGIQLAQRTPEGWSSLGTVSLLDDEIATKLAELCAKGKALAVGEFNTKIVLPSDQIKYLSLPEVDDEGREAAIKEALERTTPYLIDELVYDWEASDDGMNIAAVARDTLVEAENFITGHGFNPMCFVAAPDDALFSVEPFFGACSKYADDQDFADSIEAEVDKVILVTPSEAPMAEVVDDLGEDASIDVAPVSLADDIDQADEPDADDNSDAENVFAEEDGEYPDALETDSSDEAPKDSETGLVASREGDEGSGRTPSLGPASRTTSILGGKEPAIKRAPARGREAGQDEDVLDRSFPKWAGDAGNRRDTDDDGEPKSASWLQERKQRTSDDEEAAPPTWMRTDNAPTPEPEFEEDQEAAAWVTAPVGTVNLQSEGSTQPRYDELQTDEERFQIFGERGEKSGAGWNTNLIIAAVALVVLLIVGSFFGVRYLGSTPDPIVAEAPAEEPPVAPAVELEPDSEADVAETVEATPETQADPTPEVAEVAEPEPATPEADAPVTAEPEAAPEANPISAETALADEATAPETAQDSDLPQGTELTARQAEDTPTLPSLDSEALPATELTPPTPPAEPQTEVAETIAPQSVVLSEAPSAAVMAPTRPVSESPEIPSVEEAETTPLADPAIAEAPELPADLLARSASDWNGLSPEAREARYAATGIWPLAPAAPTAPRGESLGQLYITSADPSVFAGDAFAIPTTAEMLSDKALTTQPNPPAPGTRFERDERGLILATIEGAVTPDGITVYSGIPPVLPPLAPRESPEAALAAQRAALQGLVPRLRPEIETAAEGEPEAAEDQPATPSNRPPLRPPEIAALATVAPAVSDNPLALAETPVPRLRPATMGQIVYSTERATIAAQTTTAVAPSTATAAQAATQEDAITLRGINLIGIYGEAGDRRALVRLQSGRYSKLEVGDRLNGGRVTAIDTDRLLYVRNGQTVVLRMPAPN